MRAVPEKGEANARDRAWLPHGWALPRRSVEVAAGAKSRLKTLAVAGDRAGLAGSDRRAPGSCT